MTEALVLLFCLPTLMAALTLSATYIATIILQPNTLGPISWYLIAFLQGVVASVLLLLASPLVDQFAHALQLDDESWRLALSDLPVLVANGSSPDALQYFHLPCKRECDRGCLSSQVGRVPRCARSVDAVPNLA